MKAIPDTRVEFQHNSHWVISKTSHKCSSIPFDQAHEQENKIVKGEGGAVGLTNNPTAFRRWMFSDPEMARMLKEFEVEFLMEEDKEGLLNVQHHEQSNSKGMLLLCHKLLHKWETLFVMSLKIL